MHLPETLRETLKKPMGFLIRDGETTRENILKHLPPGSYLISVGDATTEKMVDFDLPPSLQIVDSMEKRRARDKVRGSVRTLIRCKNPAGGITEESIEAIKRGLGEEVPVRIEVAGEEDLLVLPAVLLAPGNSVVLYGQPNEGLVIVAITEEMRQKAREMMDMMA